jgi:hypothetical protein
MGSSQAKDKKFLKTVYLNWHFKTFMGKMVLDSEEGTEEILEELVAVC